ncbi:MAG: hypothetical protein KDD46_00665 [Bdellovibrionales bacterium]|nr:hypothetical protein [Bdellovibrionales bacterium]
MGKIIGIAVFFVFQVSVLFAQSPQLHSDPSRLTHLFQEMLHRGVTTTEGANENFLYLAYLNHVSEYYSHVIRPYDVFDLMDAEEKKNIRLSPFFTITLEDGVSRFTLKPLSYEERVFSTSIDGFCRTNISTDDERSRSFEYFTIENNEGKVIGKISIAFGSAQSLGDQAIALVSRIQNVPVQYIQPLLDVLAQYYKAKDIQIAIPLRTKSGVLSRISDTREVNTFYQEFSQNFEQNGKFVAYNYRVDALNSQQQDMLAFEDKLGTERIYLYQQSNRANKYVVQKNTYPNAIDLSQRIEKEHIIRQVQGLLGLYFKNRDMLRYINLIRILSYFEIEFKVNPNFQEVLTSAIVEGNQKVRRDLLFSLFVSSEEMAFDVLKLDLNKIFLKAYDLHLIEAAKVKSNRNIEKYTAIIDLMENIRLLSKMNSESYDYFIDGQDKRFKTFIYENLASYFVSFFTENHSDKLNEFKKKYLIESDGMYEGFLRYLASKNQLNRSSRSMLIQMVLMQSHLYKTSEIELDKLSLAQMATLLRMSSYYYYDKADEVSEKIQQLYESELSSLLQRDKRFTNKNYAINILQMLLVSSRYSRAGLSPYITELVAMYPKEMRVVLTETPFHQEIREKILGLEGLDVEVAVQVRELSGNRVVEEAKVEVVEGNSEQYALPITSLDQALYLLRNASQADKWGHFEKALDYITAEKIALSQTEIQTSFHYALMSGPTVCVEKYFAYLDQEKIILSQSALEKAIKVLSYEYATINVDAVASKHLPMVVEYARANEIEIPATVFQKASASAENLHMNELVKAYAPYIEHGLTKGEPPKNGIATLHGSSNGTSNEKNFGKLNWYENLLFRPILSRFISRSTFLEHVDEGLRHDKPRNGSKGPLKEQPHPDEKHWELEMHNDKLEKEKLGIQSDPYFELPRVLSDMGLTLQDHTEIELYLKMSGATTRYSHQESGTTYLHEAVHEHAKVEYIFYLVTQGYDINQEDGQKKTPYHLMIEEKYPEADVERVRRNLFVRYDTINAYGNDLIISLLLNHYSDEIVLKHIAQNILPANIVNQHNYTRLATAVTVGAGDSVILALLAEGENPAYVQRDMSVLENAIRIGKLKSKIIKTMMDQIDAETLDPRTNRRVWMRLIQRPRYSSLYRGYNTKFQPTGFGNDQHIMLVKQVLETKHTQKDFEFILDRIPFKFWSSDNMYLLSAQYEHSDRLKERLGDYLDKKFMDSPNHKDHQNIVEALKTLDVIEFTTKDAIRQNVERITNQQKQSEQKSTQKQQGTYQFVIPDLHKLQKMDALELITLLEKVPVTDIPIEGKHYTLAVSVLDQKLQSLSKMDRKGYEALAYVDVMDRLKKLAAQSSKTGLSGRISSPVLQKVDHWIDHPKNYSQRMLVESGKFALALLVSQSLRYILDPKEDLDGFQVWFNSLPKEAIKLITFSLAAGNAVALTEKIENQIYKKAGVRLENKALMELNAQAIKGHAFSPQFARRIVKHQIGFMAGLIVNTIIWHNGLEDKEFAKNLFINAGSFMSAQLVVKPVASALRVGYSVFRKGARGMRIMLLEGGIAGAAVAGVELGIEIAISHVFEGVVRKKEYLTSLEKNMRDLSFAMSGEIIGLRDKKHIPEGCTQTSISSPESIACVSDKLSFAYMQYIEMQMLKSMTEHLQDSIEDEKKIAEQYPFVHSTLMDKGWILESIRLENARVHAAGFMDLKLDRTYETEEQGRSNDVSYENYRSFLDDVRGEHLSHLKERKREYENLYASLSPETHKVLRDMLDLQYQQSNLYRSCLEIEDFERFGNCIELSQTNHQKFQEQMVQEFYQDADYQMEKSWYQRLFSRTYNGTFLDIEWGSVLDLDQMVKALRARGRSLIVTLLAQKQRYENEDEFTILEQAVFQSFLRQISMMTTLYEDANSIKDHSEIKNFESNAHVPFLTNVEVGTDIVPVSFMFPSNEYEANRSFDDHVLDMISSPEKEISVWVPYRNYAEAAASSHHVRMDIHDLPVRMELASYLVSDIWNDLDRGVFLREHGQKLQDMNNQIESEKANHMDGRQNPISLDHVALDYEKHAMGEHRKKYKDQTDRFLREKSDLAWKVAMDMMPNEDEEETSQDSSEDCYQVQFFKEDVTLDQQQRPIFTGHYTVSGKPLLYLSAVRGISCAKVREIQSLIIQATSMQ